MDTPHQILLRKMIAVCCPFLAPSFSFLGSCLIVGVGWTSGRPRELTLPFPRIAVAVSILPGLVARSTRIVQQLRTNHLGTLGVYEVDEVAHELRLLAAPKAFSKLS